MLRTRRTTTENGSCADVVPACALGSAAGRVDDEQDRDGQNQARYSGDEERGLPAVPLGDEPADEETECLTERQADHEDRHRPRAAFGRNQVADERTRGRSAGRFTNPDAKSKHEERPEPPREPGENGHRAPERNARSEEPAPVPPVREPAERQADDRVEENERRPEQAEIGIGEFPLLADPLLHGRQDLPVVEVHRVDADEHTEGEDQMGCFGHGEKPAQSEVSRHVRPEYDNARENARAGIGLSNRQAASNGTGWLPDAIPTTPETPERPRPANWTIRNLLLDFRTLVMHNISCGLILINSAEYRGTVRKK